MKLLYKKELQDLSGRFNCLVRTAKNLLTIKDPENLMPTNIKEMKETKKLINIFIQKERKNLGLI